MDSLANIFDNPAIKRYRCNEEYCTLQSSPSIDVVRYQRDRIARQIAQKISEDDSYFTTSYDDYPVGSYVTIRGDVVVLPISEFRQALRDAHAEGMKGRSYW